jgi:hypothetical protein
MGFLGTVLQRCKCDLEGFVPRVSLERRESDNIIISYVCINYRLHLKLSPVFLTYPKSLQIVLRAHTGQQEDLWRVENSCAEDDFFPCVGLPQTSLSLVRYAYSSLRAVKVNLCDTLIKSKVSDIVCLENNSLGQDDSLCFLALVTKAYFLINKLEDLPVSL